MSYQPKVYLSCRFFLCQFQQTVTDFNQAYEEAGIHYRAEPLHTHFRVQLKSSGEVIYLNFPEDSQRIENKL